MLPHDRGIEDNFTKRTVLPTLIYSFRTTISTKPPATITLNMEYRSAAKSNEVLMWATL